MLRAIRRRGHHVCFVPDNLLANPPYLQLLQRVGVEVIYHPYYHSVASFLKQDGQEFNLVILTRAEFAVRYMTSVRRFAPAQGRFRYCRPALSQGKSASLRSSPINRKEKPWPNVSERNSNL